MLAVLQAARAAAALMVVLFHLNCAFFGAAHYVPQRFSPLFDFGYAGVEFFFVLSGFVMAHVHWTDLGRPNRLSTFAWKRIRRIYPVYWAVALPLAVAYVLVPSFGDGSQRDPAAIVRALALAPAKGNPILSVAWTLQHELLFYALFSTLLLHRRLGVAVMGLWFSLCAGALFIPPQAFPISFLLSPYNLLFLLGMIAAWVLRRGAAPRPCLLAAAGVGLFLATGLQDTFLAHPLQFAPRTLAYGCGAMLAIIGLVEAERSQGLKTPASLRVLGDSSYALYLVHIPALSILAKLLFASHLNLVLPRSTIFLGMLAGAVISGLLVHFAVERPLLSLMGREKAVRRVGPPRFTSRREQVSSA